MDQIFEEEQRHLSDVYATLTAMRDDLSTDLETRHRGIAQDLRDMSEEIRPDFAGADETMETLAAIETLNSVIDAYNQSHDFAVDKLRRILLLLMQPYFAKVRLQMRPEEPAQDVYIGSTGVTDDSRRPLIVDWRSPIAETYYNQEMGPTSYQVNGRMRTATLELRRQFDISRDVLCMYFDTTVAIEDSLLLRALRRHHSEKLQAITATIQREQNAVVRHDDTPVLLVSGVAGSGKTSVLLQRIAYLFYREREALRPEQVYLFTPNDIFGRYIDTVLPSLGESNPQTFTWRGFLAHLGLSERGTGADSSPDRLSLLEERLPQLQLDPDDLRGIRVGDTVLLKPSQVAGAARKFERFPVGPRFAALVGDELHSRLERRLTQLSKSVAVHEEILSLDIDEQVEIFGETINSALEEELVGHARTYVEHRYASAHDSIDQLGWLRMDRIGMRLLDAQGISAAEWLYLKLLIAGRGERDARYVMIDEVQDYTVTQLMVLARYFSRAHFLLLGDEYQAIREGTATFDQIRSIFDETHGGTERLSLPTSYRSSPEITELFASLMEDASNVSLTSVRLPGVRPSFLQTSGHDDYLRALRRMADEATDDEGLTAIIAADRGRVSWLGKQLGERVRVVHKDESLPKEGVVLLDLGLAKGLEFDHVIIPDAQAEVYPDTPLSRRRLYTAISRALHKVSIVAQGDMTPLLADRMER
ncbi:MAG: AAA family ATPase [Acidobacteriota bacterium]|nr:AAA family ATPase [Acidobacteriota bacterium]